VLLALALSPPTAASEGAAADPLLLSLHGDAVVVVHADAATGGTGVAPAAGMPTPALPCAPARQARGIAHTAATEPAPHPWRERLAVVAQGGAASRGAGLDWAGLGMGLGMSLGPWAMPGLDADPPAAHTPALPGMVAASAVADCPLALAGALGVMALLAVPRAQREAAGFSASARPTWRWAVRRHGVRVALLDGRGGHLGLDLSVRRRDDGQTTPGGDRRETRVMLRWRVAF
jgi:hypothetical protein